MIDAKRSPAVRLSLSLIASMLIAVIGLFLVRCLAPASWLHANNEVAGNYLQTVGTIYAVLLAFVVFVVWQQHNDTRSAVESEANELTDFCRTIRALPGTQPVRDSIQEYGRVVVDKEWLDMARGRWSRVGATCARVNLECEYCCTTARTSFSFAGPSNWVPSLIGRWISATSPTLPSSPSRRSYRTWRSFCATIGVVVKSRCPSCPNGACLRSGRCVRPPTRIAWSAPA